MVRWLGLLVEILQIAAKLLALWLALLQLRRASRRKPLR